MKFDTRARAGSAETYAFSTPIIFSPVGDQLYLDPAVLKAASSRKLEKVEARLRSSKYNLFN